MTFVQARWFTPTSGREIDLIVVHSMEVPEKADTAEGVARYFQTTDKKASAHYCVDGDSEVQCVRDMDVAYHAPGANHNGIGIEHAGYARQTTAEWVDAYGDPMLSRSARLTALLCRQYNVPAKWLTVGEVRGGLRGITSHNNVSLAFGKSTHTDPGPGFPSEEYMRRVRAALNPQGDDMTPEQDQLLRDVNNRTIALVDEVAKLKAGGATVDLDALANKVADKLAERLKG